MRNTGKRILCLLLAVMMLAASGCTLPGTNLAMDEIPESTEGRDLTMGKAADDIFSLNINRKYSFNPLIATNHSNQLVCSLVYENVVEVDNSFSVIPSIATEWECNDSATSWLLTIDNTRTFHDGTPVTARDVRYSITLAYQYIPHTDTHSHTPHMHIHVSSSLVKALVHSPFPHILFFYNIFPILNSILQTFFGLSLSLLKQLIPALFFIQIV